MRRPPRPDFRPHRSAANHPVRWIWRRGILAGMLWIAAAALPAREPRPLLMDPPAEEKAGEPRAFRDAKRTRRAAIDFRAIPGAPEMETPLLDVRLFPDVAMTAVLEKFVDRGKDGFTWFGRAKDDPLSAVQITAHGGAMVANFRLPGKGEFRILGVADGSAVVSELDPASFRCGGAPLPPAVSEYSGASALPKADEVPDDGSTIDVMTLYSAAALADWGSENAITAAIYSGVDYMNHALAESGVALVVRLVHAGLVNYAETGVSSTDLGRLQDAADGHMDEIHAWRDAYAADLVYLALSDLDVGGRGYLNCESSTTEKAPQGFSVNWSGSIDKGTPAHEWGHNLGCHHDRGSTDGIGCDSYSFGHFFRGRSGNKWGTIMSYWGDRIPRFSNPGTMFDGVPTGLAEGDPNAADNARTIRERQFVTANFRASSTATAPIPTPRPSATPSASPTPSPTRTPTPTPSSTSLATATPSPSPSPWPTATPAGSCPVRSLSLGFIPPAGEAEFAKSVAMTEERTLLGGGNAAHLYDNASGALLATLANPSPESDSGFGASAAMEGGFALVGAPLASSGGILESGAAYYMALGDGSVVHVLENPAPTNADQFGAAVAISGSRLLVGSPYEDADGYNRGVVYIFDAATGALASTIHSPELIESGGFGAAISVSGGLALIGAPTQYPGERTGGAAAIADIAAGLAFRVLARPEPVEGDQFGSAVALSHGLALVGAPYDSSAGPFSRYAGSAHLFDAGTGELKRSLQEEFPVEWDNFGASVGLSGGIAIVGARFMDYAAFRSGAARLISVEDGTILQTLLPPDPSDWDRFGWTVALAGNTAFAGSPYGFTGNANGRGLLFGLHPACPSPTPSPSPTATPQPQPVVFADPALEAAVRDQANLPDGPIFPWYLTLLTRIDAESMNISSLSGLEACSSLTGLEIAYNPVSDLTPLAGMTRLRDLNAYGARIADISSLSGMTELRYLNLGHNEIAGIGALAGKTELGWLSLRSNLIEDISPLTASTKLTVLDLPGNRIAAVDSLAGMTLLDWANLGNNRISGLSPMTGLVRLRQLYLYENSVASAAPLAGLTLLERLDLRSNRIEDAAPFAGMTRLERLDLGDNRISDATPLGNLTNLRELYLMVNRIASPGPIAGLPILDTLDLSSNGIADLSFAAGMTSLRAVDFSFNQIADASPLVANSGLSAGDFVSLAENPLTCESAERDIPILASRGVSVYWSQVCVTPSPTPSPSETPSPSPAASETPTPTPTVSETPGPTPTPASTPAPTLTPAPSPSPTATAEPVSLRVLQVLLGRTAPEPDLDVNGDGAVDAADLLRARLRGD